MDLECIAMLDNDSQPILNVPQLIHETANVVKFFFFSLMHWQCIGNASQSLPTKIAYIQNYTFRVVSPSE